MTTAVETLQDIQEFARLNSDDSLQVVPPLKVGEYTAQGDINIWHLDKLPEGIEEVPTVAQLAPGTARGSRHCIKQADLVNVTQYKLKDANALQGPIFELSGPITIEHPEHGDQLWQHSKYIFITYQRRYSEDLQRIAD